MIITDLSENCEIIDSIYKIYAVSNVKECYCDIDMWKIKLHENTDIINPFTNIFSRLTSSGPCKSCG